jgi:hypothetical protein
MSYATLDSVIHQTQNLLDDPNPQRHYGKLLGFAHKWFSETNAAGARPKTILLDVGPDRVAALPPDFVDFLCLGRQVGNKVRNLAYNANLSLYDTEPFVEPPSLDLDVNEAWPSWQYAGWEVDGKPVVGYGYGEYSEDFTIDTTERVVRLGSIFHPGEPLILCYQATMHTPGQATPIHENEQNQLDYYLRWQFYLAKGNLSMSREFERLYSNARKQLKIQDGIRKFGFAELKQVLAGRYTQQVR